MIKPGMLKFRFVSGFVTAALLALLVAVAAAAPADSITGDWEGTLDTGSGTLRVVVHIKQDKDGKLSGAIDSLDQGASGIEITAITYKTPDLHFECDRINGGYDGKLGRENGQITGEWKQNGASLPLTLKRVAK